MKKLQIYKMNLYVGGKARILGIHKKGDLNYPAVKKRLDIETSATIIEYEKISSGNDFSFGIVNFMKLLDFKKHFTLIK